MGGGADAHPPRPRSPLLTLPPNLLAISPPTAVPQRRCRRRHRCEWTMVDRQTSKRNLISAANKARGGGGGEARTGGGRRRPDRPDRWGKYLHFSLVGRVVGRALSEGRVGVLLPRRRWRNEFAEGVIMRAFGGGLLAVWAEQRWSHGRRLEELNIAPAAF